MNKYLIILEPFKDQNNSQKELRKYNFYRDYKSIKNNKIDSISLK